MIQDTLYCKLLYCLNFEIVIFMQVDENVNTESLERIVTYFNTLHNTLLLQSGDTGNHQGQLLADTGKAILCAIDSINTDVNIVLALTQVIFLKYLFIIDKKCT